MPSRHSSSSLARTLRRACGLLLLPCALLAGPAAAQSAPPAAPEQTESCPPLIARGVPRPRVLPAAFRPPASLPVAGSADVTLSFVGHATFLIVSPGGVRIATDYNDYVRPPLPLDIATMNKAHSTHYSDHPDPGIAHVLRGWNPAGTGPARYDLTVGDVRVRNVTTNIRNWYGAGEGATEYDANSIFVFEAGGLCVAHLGHLHHPLTPEHLKALGRIDVALVPVDGSYTLDLPGMMDVLASLNARLMLPMHYFGQATLERFLTLARARYAVETRDSPTLALSRETLPAKPTVIVLPGR
jgi:L-ascorbate metabolism protein UlaG (beta-lactamase superfamily)